MTEISDKAAARARVEVSEWLGEREGYAIRAERVSGEAIPWLEMAWALGAIGKTDKISAVLKKWCRRDHISLHVGEITAQEFRTILAVIHAIEAEIRDE